MLMLQIFVEVLKSNVEISLDFFLLLLVFIFLIRRLKILKYPKYILTFGKCAVLVKATNLIKNYCFELFKHIFADWLSSEL